MHLPSDPDFARDATEYLIAKFKKELKRKAVVVVLGNDPIFSHYIFHGMQFLASIRDLQLHKFFNLFMAHKILKNREASVKLQYSCLMQFCIVYLGGK